MKIQFIFKWFDFWVGLFWDQKKKWLYILPFPTIGIILKFNKPPKVNIDDPNAPWNWRTEHLRNKQGRTPDEQALHEWMEDNPR